MAFCEQCGKELMANTKFCTICGHPVTQPPAVSTPIGQRATGPLPLGGYLKTGWELFKRYPGGFIGFFLAYMGVQIGLSLIPYLGSLAGFVVGAPLYVGFFIVSAKLLQNRTPQFGDFFLGFRFFLPLLLVTLVWVIIGAVFGLLAVILVFVAGLGAAKIGVAGILLLSIPVITYLAIAYLLAPCLVVDRRLGFWEALETSRRTMQPLWFGMLGFLLVLTLINLAGILCLGVGLLITAPLTWCALTAAYADIFGLQSNYAEGFPDNLPAAGAPGA